MPPCRNPSQETDKAAVFVDLLTSHQRELYSYINALLVGHNGAADVLQDANLELWKHLHDYDFSRPFLPWAYAFAFQSVLAFRTKLSRSRLIFSDETVQAISDAYLEDAADDDTRVAALRGCVEKLDPAGRHLIRERYMGRASVQTIANQAGATANQVSARLYRLRRILARCVETTLAREAR
jgi:RNA polymerase sigma-70 factor (ECF subfamily)